MRLTKLKLSGFKSFVDPTTVQFPGQLAGVVGPNGCGKSNIIDAVRWVLGESKAAELRGESIQDVIFKGSGTRKEVSRASVELSFDNTQGRAAGQWSQYAEITVRRVLDREGNSNYYINNLHVRRRDVIDLFLGTGLGPRAYAIIGQGMVSRIVEARPDEMRVFLEEAAGVTRYKERRKETQNRLEDARENLARVDDIRGELDGQIGRLEVQAEVARQYRELQQHLLERQNLLWLKKRNDARRDAQKAAADVAQAINRVEQETAQLREIEARLEQARSAHFAASDELHATQGEKYAAEAEVGRLESELVHVRDSRLRLEARQIKLTEDLAHWSEQSRSLQQEARRWQDLLQNAGVRSEVCDARHAEALAQLEQAEQTLQTAQEEYGAAQRAVQGSEQSLRLADADRGHADRALDGLRQRRARLDEEKAALARPDPLEVERSQEQVAQAEDALAAQQTRVSDIQAALPGLESQLRQARERLQTTHRKHTETRARAEALKQLQARVQQSGEIGAWLKSHGLDDAQPLWKSLHVEAGWETAVEAVLRERLSALAAPRATLQAALAAPAPNTFALALAEEAHNGTSAPPQSLRAKVRCDDARWAAVLDEWLAGILAAEDLVPLEPAVGQAYVNRTGHLRSRHGLVLYVPDARTHGVIERQREIEELDQQMTALADEEAEAREAQQQAEQQLNTQQGELGASRRRVQEVQQQLHGAQVEALKLNQAQARYEERVAQIDRDLAEVQRAEDQEIAGQARAAEQSELHREQLDTLRERLHQAADRQKHGEAALRETRALEQQHAREAQEARFSTRECEGKLVDNARAAETAAQQLERLAAEQQSVQQDLLGISDAVLHEQLQSALAVRGERESLLAEKREALETAGTALRELEEGRLRIEQSLNPLRERINDLRLKQQAVELNEANFQERLVEAGIVGEAEEAPLQALLVPGLRESGLNADIARLSGEIEALGAVNLAALEELTSAKERKGFLDAQSGDLATAITTLEDAIRRIDRETREQLQDTYDTVNRHFGELFPGLFGGGEARLVLTGEEILDAGIQIMAHPPGKKNTTIHMLSGGEKALTAIALVFAMFQLNPAPFCLLDEVDAPLDDSNTERFCEMLKRMSTQTQFIYISHNKITMEMAQQLIGVTMQERGVSRIVDVDMDEAMRLTGEQKAN